MEIQHPVICLCLVFLCSAWAQVDPRGSRPIEHGYKADTCATEKNWPFCSDDDWGPKCPSGCRLQGLVDKADNQLQKKVQKIRDLLATNNANHRSADHASKQTYDYLKERLTSDAGSDNSYYDLAERLRQRIVDMKIKIDRQLGILQALKSRVKDQVVEMQRLEVDIDIKLRSCKGSCKGYAEFSVDKDSYVALDKQMDQLEAQSIQSVTTVSSMSVMKSRVLKDVVVDSRFKAANPDAKEVVFFSDVKTLALTLEAEGSSASSAATVSKGPGTTLHRGDGGGGVVGGGDHFMGGGGGGGGGGGTGHTTTVSCTKTVKKITVHTKDGPQERYEEVVTGGPGCGSGAGTGTGTGMGGDGLKGFFSSSSSSKSLSSTGGTKGSSISDLGSDPFGFDLGGFMRGNTDDDVPDFHARSVKSVRTERQADYVGKVCTLMRQQSGVSPQRERHTRRDRDRRGWCPARPQYPLCSDDEWGGVCPSGCRLQGALSAVERQVGERLREVCERTERYQDTQEASMVSVTHIYNSRRRHIVITYVAELKYVAFAEELARNLTLLRKRAAALSRKLGEQQSRVQRQIEDMYRMEVDIDIKLRSCQGSCRRSPAFHLDQDSYRSMSKAPEERQRSKVVEDIKKIKLQPVDMGPPPSREYRTIPLVQKEFLTQFEDIEQNQVVLEDIEAECLQGSVDVLDCW